MALSDRAAAMYRTWFPLVADAVRDAFTTGKPGTDIIGITEAASELARSNNYPRGSLDTPGLSSLYSAQLKVARSSYNLSQAADTDVLTSAHVAQDMFGRTAAEQAALPMYRATVQATYLDESGAQVTGTFTQFYYHRLPPTVGSLRQHAQLDVTDQLATPPPTGTPRTGTLVSVDRITLTAV